LDEFKEGDMPELSEKLPDSLKQECSNEELLKETEEPSKDEESEAAQVKEATVVETPNKDSISLMPPMPTIWESDKSSGHPDNLDITPEGFYDISQLAERFECSEATIGRYISVGGKTKSGSIVKLKCEKVGGKRLISKSSLEAFECAGIKRRKRRKKSEVESK
jgi:hypothetical protein